MGRGGLVSSECVHHVIKQFWSFVVSVIISELHADQLREGVKPMLTDFRSGELVFRWRGGNSGQ